MSLGLRISTIISTILITVSVVGWMLLMWLYEAGNHGGYQIVFYFWVLPTIFGTVFSCLISLGIWLGKRNRDHHDDQSLHL